MTYSDIELKRDTKRLLPEWGKHVDYIDLNDHALFVCVSNEDGTRLSMGDPDTCLLGELYDFSETWTNDLECMGCKELDTELTYSGDNSLSFRKFLESVINHIEEDHIDWVKSHK